MILATIAMYMWGFAYWGASGLPYRAWRETPNDRAAGEALLEHFPESGTYYIPANGNPPDLRAELYESGPTGFVFIRREGRPEFDPSIMIRGFIHNGLVAVLIAALMSAGMGATPTYRKRVALSGLAGLAGLTAAILIHIGDAVWWVLPWHWELAKAFYHAVVWLLAAAILAHFIRPQAAPLPR